MARTLETDVLIIGGGPAGAAAALALRTHANLRVLLAEGSALDACRPGEQVHVSLFDLLAYLRIERHQLGADQCIRSYSSQAAWGSAHVTARHSIFSTAGESYQLDREAFDGLLLRTVAERGGLVLPRTKCLRLTQRADAHWQATLHHQERGRLEVKARFLVDATGRQGSIGRQLGLQPARHDQLAAVGTFVQCAAGTVLEQHTLLETVPQGWWYCSTLPNQTMAVTLFTDADIIREGQLHKSANWQRLLAATQHVRKAMNRAKPAAIWTRNAFSQVSNPAARPNFLAVGDAAAAFDPIAAMGLGFAISSGCQAARAIQQAQAGDQAALGDYQRGVAAIFKDYLPTQARFYNQERRWATDAFWARRLAVAA